ncbi:MAG TPA: tetratricopeptide repeat protein [Longimicrobiales bacterium]|nr:tetratricopeptide repeat protein [Longimicrobiales bacterium]
MTKRLSSLALAGLVLLAIAGCSPPDDQRTDTLDPTTAGRELSGDARVQLDSGNAAFRAGDYPQALVHFTRVTELAPDDATGWFGIYMAHDAMGNQAAADSAIATARSQAPGASLIRDTVEGGA